MTPDTAIGSGDIWAHEASFKELAMTLRQVLHLDMLDALMTSAEKKVLKD